MATQTRRMAISTQWGASRAERGMRREGRRFILHWMRQSGEKLKSDGHELTARASFRVANLRFSPECTYFPFEKIYCSYLYYCRNFSNFEKIMDLTSAPCTNLVPVEFLYGVKCGLTKRLAELSRFCDLFQCR